MTNGNKMSSARETVYDRCAYVGCYNGKFINGRRLFHFPSETDRRLEMWIERSGNFRLRTWAATSLRKAGLCGDHFDDKCFTNVTRKALRRNVVPRHYTEDGKFRKTNVQSNTENNENNENNKNNGRTSEEREDNPLNCEIPLSTLDESTMAVQFRINGVSDETSLQSGEHVVDEADGKAADGRSPSPVVEFIVEELDENLIFDEFCKAEHRCSPTLESSVGESICEYEEKVQVENDESRGQSSSPMRLEDIKDSIGLSETGLRVNRSDSDVRTYYRSKNHCRSKLELPSAESETYTDEEILTTVDTNPTFRAGSVARENKTHEKTLLTLRDENTHLRKTVRMLKQKVRRAKAREANYMKVRDMLKNVDEFLNIQECTNPVARAMAKLALHKRNASYTKEEKDFAMQLYRHSSTAFVRLRRSGCNFPGQSTVKRWLSEDQGQLPSCDFMTMMEAEENEMVEDIHEIGESTMVEEVEGNVEEMEEAVEDAEDAIDELVEHLAEQIEEADGHEEYVEELPPDEDEQEDLK